MEYKFDYLFPILQEAPVIGWEDVIKEIVSNRQSKQKIEKSNTLFEDWALESQFPDIMLRLKRTIIETALKSKIDLEQFRWQTRKPENETVVSYNSGVKVSEQVILPQSLSSTDLQIKAPRLAEKTVSELIHEFYKYPLTGEQCFGNDCDPVCKNIFTIKLKETEVPEHEVFGQNTHPDLYFNFECVTKDDEILNLHILVEVKSVLAQVHKPNNKLEINYNNASNCLNNVLEDLDTFNKKDIFTSNTPENANKTKIYSTLCSIIYYFPDAKNNDIKFFDTDLLWMPMCFEYDIDPNTGQQTEKKIKVKSAGQNSQNNNANLSLATPAGIYEDQDILFDSMLLHLTGKTSQGLDHLLTKQEVELESKRINSLVLTTIMEQFENVSEINIDDIYQQFCDSYAIVQKHTDKKFRETDEETHQFVYNVYLNAQEFIKKFKIIHSHCHQCKEIKNDILDLLDIQDSMNYKELKNECDFIRKHWSNIKKIDERFCENKTEIQQLVDSFKQELADKKKLENELLKKRYG